MIPTHLTGHFCKIEFVYVMFLIIEGKEIKQYMVSTVLADGSAPPEWGLNSGPIKVREQHLKG